MEAFIRFSYEVFGTPKVVAVVVILFITTFKIIKSRIDKSREEKTGRISEMIAEIEKNHQPRYHFVVEQVFQNRFGFLIDYPVIKVFMSSDTPTSDLLKYIQGYRYLDFNDDYTKIGYKGSLNKTKLNARKYLFLFGYFVCSFFGIGSIAVLPEIGFEHSAGFVVYLFFIFSMLFLAYLFLDDSTRQQSAIGLIEKYQNKSIKVVREKSI
ncbi:hypothetical protein [Vibrio vulnificus]|uniref:Uncharacterized protein n=1 Tax=Vibrio vulnificus TaxID=672 RepID=A0AAN1PNG4_VIBVL|nr:hypothetical protein [Vibrio vulnificus]AXX59715.1 hypothetical protein FORC53_1376 [Vibrio vulnificus]